LFSSTSNGFLADFIFSLSRIRYLIYRSLLVQRVASRGSVLGLLFVPLMLILSCLAISAVWNQLFGRGGEGYWEFFLYVYLSFVLWVYIGDLVNGGSSCLIRNSVYGTTSNDPAVMYIFQESLNATVSFILKLPFLVIVFILLAGLPSFYGVLLFCFGITLIFLSGLGFGMVMGVYCLFYMDLRELTAAVMRVAFLLTPIIWQVERLGEYQKYIYFNPFYSYLSICRDSLLTGQVGHREIVIASSCTLFLLLLGCFSLARNKIAVKRAFFKI